jgi:hypothetical protein
LAAASPPEADSFSVQETPFSPYPPPFAPSFSSAVVLDSSAHAVEIVREHDVELSHAESDALGLAHGEPEPVLKPSQVVYAGRLKERMPAWRRLASPFICDWIEKGVPIEF